MSGQAVSGHSRAEQRQRPPERCARCRRKVRDGEGQRVDRAIVCQRCAPKDTAR